MSLNADLTGTLEGVRNQVEKIQQTFAVQNFLEHVQKISDEHMKLLFPDLSHPKFLVEFSKKWAKIVKIEDNRRSVYAFIALQNFSTKELGNVIAGDIHRPASWNKPAKHARGCVGNESTWNCAGPYGIAYLK